MIMESMSISDWHYHFWLSRSRRPIEAATPEIIDKVHDIVLIDEWKCASLLRPQAYHMAQWFQFCTNNWIWKSYQWVPRLLTVDHDRVTISKQCLEMFQRNSDKFLRRFITVDETWIHYFTPETKEQSKQWTSSGEPVPKKAKTVKSVGKIMAIVFWDTV